jgi:hypothetical protein
VLTDYAPMTTWFDEDCMPESYAKARLDNEIVMSKDLFVMEHVRIEGPEYSFRHYEDFPEYGESRGERRRLSDFHGFGADRDGVTVLVVRIPRDGRRTPWNLEVIDRDTLWDCDGTWVYQWRRKGATSPAIPLSRRYEASVNALAEFLDHPNASTWTVLKTLAETDPGSMNGGIARWFVELETAAWRCLLPNSMALEGMTPDENAKANRTRLADLLRAPPGVDRWLLLDFLKAMGGQEFDESLARTASAALRFYYAEMLEPLWGSYVVTDYALMEESPYSPSPEAEAKARVGEEVVIRKERFSLGGDVIAEPEYRFRYVEGLADYEGVVYPRQRWCYSDWSGFGAERESLNVLEVGPQGHPEATEHALEIIENDTLWFWEGQWLFQLRRKGAKRPTVPLKDRWMTGGGNDDSDSK